MVATTVEASLAMEIYQVDEQLLADAAGEAGWMPDGVRSETCRQDDDVSLRCLLLALQESDGKKAKNQKSAP